MAEDRSLPGYPSKRLVKEVRSRLWWFGIRPINRWSPSGQDIWKLTWEWAHKQTWHWKRTRWPSANDIADQYVFLLLLEIKVNHGLRPLSLSADKSPAGLKELIAAARSERKPRRPMSVLGAVDACPQMELFDMNDE